MLPSDERKKRAKQLFSVCSMYQMSLSNAQVLKNLPSASNRQVFYSCSFLSSRSHTYKTPFLFSLRTSITSSWNLISAPTFNTYAISSFFHLLPQICAWSNVFTGVDLQAGWEPWIQERVLLSASSSQAKWNLTQPWEFLLRMIFPPLARFFRAKYLVQPHLGGI